MIVVSAERSVAQELFVSQRDCPVRGIGTLYVPVKRFEGGAPCIAQVIKGGDAENIAPLGVNFVEVIQHWDTHRGLTENAIAVLGGLWSTQEYKVGHRFKGAQSNLERLNFGTRLCVGSRGGGSAFQ